MDGREALIGALACLMPHWVFARALIPATVAGGGPIGRGKMLVVKEDAAGRVVAFDSLAYINRQPADGRDALVAGSHCGGIPLAPRLAGGVRTLIASDAGISKDDAGVNGLICGETIGMPVAASFACCTRTRGRGGRVLA